MKPLRNLYRNVLPDILNYGFFGFFAHRILCRKSDWIAWSILQASYLRCGKRMAIWITVKIARVLMRAGREEYKFLAWGYGLYIMVRFLLAGGAWSTGYKL